MRHGFSHDETVQPLSSLCRHGLGLRCGLHPFLRPGIELLRSASPRRRGRDAILAPGDDCACWSDTTACVCRRAIYSFDLRALVSLEGPEGTDPANVTWSVFSGTLPASLVLSGNAISGTPTEVSTPATVKLRAEYAFGYQSVGVMQGYVFEVPVVGVRDFGAYRAWADGTFAQSCEEYIRPVDANHAYTGATGDGVYRISPAGTLLNVYCDQSSDSGGWTLLGNQVRTSLFSSTTNDIGDVNSASLDATWRFGDVKVQSVPATTAYRLQSVSPSTQAAVDTLYFSSDCTISYKDTWNQAKLSNSMPTSCRTAYPTLAMTAPVPSVFNNVSANGIGTNNGGQYCSMRFAESPKSMLKSSAASDCLSSTQNTMRLWVR